MKKIFEHWRIVVFVLAVAWIIYRLISKNESVSYVSVPMVVTTVAVTLIKIIAVVAIIFLVKFLVRKLKR